MKPVFTISLGEMKQKIGRSNNYVLTIDLINKMVAENLDLMGNANNVKFASALITNIDKINSKLGTTKNTQLGMNSSAKFMMSDDTVINYFIKEDGSMKILLCRLDSDKEWVVLKTLGALDCTQTVDFSALTAIEATPVVKFDKNVPELVKSTVIEHVNTNFDKLGLEVVAKFWQKGDHRRVYLNGTTFIDVAHILPKRIKNA